MSLPHDRPSGGPHRGTPDRRARQRGLGAERVTPPTASRWKPVVIYQIDPASDTIRTGHYYSEKVDRGGPEINAWMRGPLTMPATQSFDPFDPGADAARRHDGGSSPPARSPGSVGHAGRHALRGRRVDIVSDARCRTGTPRDTGCRADPQNQGRFFCFEYDPPLHIPLRRLLRDLLSRERRRRHRGAHARRRAADPALEGRRRKWCEESATRLAGRLMMRLAGFPGRRAAVAPLDRDIVRLGLLVHHPRRRGTGFERCCPDMLDYLDRASRTGPGPLTARRHAQAGRHRGDDGQPLPRTCEGSSWSASRPPAATRWGTSSTTRSFRWPPIQGAGRPAAGPGLVPERSRSRCAATHRHVAVSRSVQPASRLHDQPRRRREGPAGASLGQPRRRFTTTRRPPASTGTGPAPARRVRLGKPHLHQRAHRPPRGRDLARHVPRSGRGDRLRPGDDAAPLLSPAGQRAGRTPGPPDSGGRSPGREHLADGLRPRPYSASHRARTAVRARSGRCGRTEGGVSPASSASRLRDRPERGSTA